MQKNRRVPIILTIGTILVVSCKKTSACDEVTARLVARAYVLSIPLFFKENDLIPLMADSKDYFLEDGKAIRCMQTLGTALTQSGMADLEQNREYSATERFGGSMPEGLEHLPGQVDASIQSYGNDMFTMGQELLWLSQVLPPAAEGDYEPYKTTATATRQLMAQILPIYQMLYQMDSSMYQMMQNMMQQMQPILEQHVYLLVRQLND